MLQSKQYSEVRDTCCRSLRIFTNPNYKQVSSFSFLFIKIKKKKPKTFNFWWNELKWTSIQDLVKLEALVVRSWKSLPIVSVTPLCDIFLRIETLELIFWELNEIWEMIRGDVHWSKFIDTCGRGLKINASTLSYVSLFLLFSFKD